MHGRIGTFPAWKNAARRSLRRPARAVSGCGAAQAECEDLDIRSLTRRVLPQPYWEFIMLSHSGITKPCFGPMEIEMLHEVLIKWCGERGCELNSDPAREAAKEAVSWFECGIRERNRLFQLLRCIEAAVSS
jgi:hypothetical protein